VPGRPGDSRALHDALRTDTDAKSFASVKHCHRRTWRSRSRCRAASATRSRHAVTTARRDYALRLALLALSFSSPGSSSGSGSRSGRALASVEAAAPPHHHDGGAAMPQPPTSSVASRTFALWHCATPPGKPLGWLCATRMKNTVSLTTRSGWAPVTPESPRPRDPTGDSSGDLQARVLASCLGSHGRACHRRSRAARRDTP